MKRLIDVFYSFRHYGVVALVVLPVFLALGGYFFPKVTRQYQSPNEALFRLQHAWTSDNFKATLTEWSTNKPEAAVIYKEDNLKKLDLLFPLIYSLLIASTYAWGRGTSAKDSRWDYLFPVLIVLTALLDYSENALHLYLLQGIDTAEQIRAATFSPWLVGFSTIVSSIKMFLFTMGSVGAIVAVIRRLSGLNRPVLNTKNCLDLPLHLFQVLEQEYLTIHGEMSQEKVIDLHDRKVTAVLDWAFHESHIRDASALWNRMTVERAEAGKKSLAHHFNACLSPSQQIPYPPDVPDARQLTVILNNLLNVHLYGQNEFKQESLPSIQQIVDLGLYADQVSGNELRHFNRLLLEDLFPDEVEKVRDIRLAAMVARLHEKRQTALSLSGGGTRSGTFALGLLQGLAKQELLCKFNYLSTVSGGGYIGGWLSAWILRHKGGFKGVNQDLVNDKPASKIDPDPAPIGYLRAYSNFLTPKVGLFSADTWTFIAIYGRNLLLNWSVLIPILLAFLFIPRLAVSFVLDEPQTKVAIFGHDVFIRHFFLILGAALAIWSTAYARANRPGFRTKLKDRWPFLAKHADQDGFVFYCLLPLFFAGVLLTTYWAWTGHEDKTLAAFALSGAALPIAGGLLSWAILWKQGRVKELLAACLAGLIGGLTIGAAASFLQPLGPNWSTEIYVCAALPLFLLIFHLGSTMFMGLSSHTAVFNDEDREWWARFNALSLIAATAWAVFSSLVIFGPLILMAAPKTITSLGGVSGLVATVLGRSEKTPSDNQDSKDRLGMAMGFVLPAFAAVFLGIVVASLSLLTSLGLQAAAKLVPSLIGLPLEQIGVVGQLSAMTHFRLVHYPSVGLIAGLMILLGGTGFGLSRLINLNFFSLHGGYRNRLIRGFLGASRGERLRKPNPFTGFDPADNIYMHELRPALLHESDVLDFEGLALQLAGTPIQGGLQDPQAEYIYGRLSDRVKSDLQDYAKQTVRPPLSQRLKVDLLEDLNRILEEGTTEQGVALYEHPVFRHIWSTASKRDLPMRDYYTHRNRWVLEKAFPNHIRMSDYPPHRLFHVVNTTLNLVGGKNLAWQQRKAESFTVSPLHSGAHRVGYRKSRDYGGEDGISMGTAFAVSGAAASSNMGYYTSSPLISILLTLFNVRLGWWLGNPGIQGSRLYTPYGRSKRKMESERRNRIYRRNSPVFSIMPLVYEALGLTDDQHKYVYLSDGGHFENLALYEMVLRRCHLIVLSDGAADPDYEFSDLGNAIRKIRIDLGIRIEFDGMPISKQKPKDKEQGGGYWAIARICYSDVDGKNTPDGVLIYIKPAVYFDEPQDICNYKRQFPDFPHETTADQFFDEPQFESHRALGAYIMQKMCESQPTAGDVRQFVESVTRQSQLAQQKWFKDWLDRAGPPSRIASDI